MTAMFSVTPSDRPLSRVMVLRAASMPIIWAGARLKDRVAAVWVAKLVIWAWRALSCSMVIWESNCLFSDISASFSCLVSAKVKNELKNPEVALAPYINGFEMGEDAALKELRTSAWK